MWYIGTDDGKFGPMTAEKVLNMMDTGELDKTNGNAFIAHSSYGKIPSWKPLDQEAEGMLLRSYRANMIVDDRMSVSQPHMYDEDDSVIQTDAYYTIVGMLGNKTETGSALLIQVNNKFGGVKRGDMLWQWLVERAGNANMMSEGLIDAREAKREVEEYN